jgi:hypothetical protein
MKKIYAVFEGTKIVRMSINKKELVKYIQSFPEQERRKFVLAERFVRSPKERQQSQWTEVEKEKTK